MNTRPVPTQTAMMAAVELPQSTDVPDWIQLLPNPQDGKIRTTDARGPYTLAGTPDQVIAASFADADALEVDVNHATYLAAPKGERADAVGWVREMQSRPDGVWGRVEWTPEGQRLVGEKAYRRISPVIVHDAAKRILKIANVSLVNRPNLRGLAALNMETSEMTLHARLAAKLGLGAEATEDQLISAIPDGLPALQSAMAEIGVALSVQGNDPQAIVAAAKAQKTAQPAEVTALQAEITSLTTQLNTLTEGNKRDKATAFVDGAIAKGHVGVKPSRDRFIAMHMADPAGTEEVIGRMPILAAGSTTTIASPPAGGEQIALNAEELSAARALGKDPKEFAALMAADRKAKETV